MDIPSASRRRLRAVVESRPPILILVWVALPVSAERMVERGVNQTVVRGGPDRSQLDSAAMAESDLLFEDALGEDQDPMSRDPLESMNRGIFRGNLFLDEKLFTPAARAYRWALPDLARGAVRGVFENLGQPGVIVNDLLQGEGDRAKDASTRFLLNTTVGLAGIWDPATMLGIEAHSSDFGQTLGKAGVGSGPYLVLPVFGPNTTRDLVGDVVDMALRPDTWLLPFGSRLVLSSTDGISLKDANLEAIDALEQSSVDFYVAMRSAYLMNREAMVNESGAATGELADAIPATLPDPLAPEGPALPAVSAGPNAAAEGEAHHDAPAPLP